MITNKIAHWRSTLHEGKGISQARLAQLIGVGRSYVKKLEKGTRLPSWELAFELVRVLKQPLEAIFQLGDGEQVVPAIICAKTIPERQPLAAVSGQAKLLRNDPESQTGNTHSETISSSSASAAGRS